MISLLELRRVVSEWKTRFQRVQSIIKPPTWNETDWKKFGKALIRLLQKSGATWTTPENQKVYWDLRWHLRDGGELICQAEHTPNEKISIVVAQMGGFVREVESYTWFWAEFNMKGEFVRDPYWVEGTWKEALATLLLPFQYQAGYFLNGTAPTPPSLMLGNTENKPAETLSSSSKEVSPNSPKETIHESAYVSS